MLTSPHAYAPAPAPKHTSSQLDDEYHAQKTSRAYGAHRIVVVTCAASIRRKCVGGVGWDGHRMEGLTKHAQTDSWDTVIGLHAPPMV